MRPPLDGVLAFALTLAGLAAAYALYGLGQIVTDYVRVWGENRRERIARQHNREAHGYYSDPARPRMVEAAPRAARHEPPQSLTSSRRAWNGHQDIGIDGLGNRFPPLPQSHVGAQSGSHGVEQGGVTASEFKGHTRLTWTPPPDRAA